MSQLDALEPRAVWGEFFEICKIPHGSGNIDALRAFLRQRAESRGFKCFEDGEAGNLLIVKEADPGFEKAPVICLQGHLDMVCSKRADTPHDFKKDPIKPRIAEVDGKQCVLASGTTLGADDGMGIAIALAYIFDKNNKSGRIEVLCTKDEETTMHGVHHISDSFLTAKYLINIDSEDVGVITIGSAGGFCGDIFIDKLPSTTVTGACKCETLRVFSCQGGHSGVDIHHYRANAIKVLSRLVALAVQHGGQICCVRGGTAHNAIPMDAEACVCFHEVDDAKLSDFKQAAAKLCADLVAEYKSTDPNIKVSVEDQCSSGNNCTFISQADSRRVADLLNILPYGVLRMSPDVQGLVESSINMGTVVFTAETGGKINMLARSSINSFLPYVDEKLRSIVRLTGFRYEGNKDAYGGWAPNVDSLLLKVCREEYSKALNIPESKINVEAIHAGLECGELISKYHGMEAVSIGPTIKNPHSDRELVEVDTVAPVYQVVKNTIARLSQ